MSVSINLNQTFRGIQLRNLRPLLAEWLLGSRSFSHLSRLSKIDLDEYTIVGLIEECHRAGFMDFQPAERARPGVENKFLKLTGQGIGIASAAATKRTDKAIAYGHLNKLLERCRANNANELSPIEIGEVWIYGSMLDDEKLDVGDIDLVVLARRKEAFKGQSITRHIDEHFPGLLPETRDSLFFDADSTFTQKIVYGPRRHAIFSPNSLDILIKLHQPCAKAFDIEAGGVIEIVKLPHHPLSTGRADSIQPRATMPIFPVPLHPFTPTPAYLGAGRLTDSMWSAHDFDVFPASEAEARLDGRLVRGPTVSDAATVFVPGRQNKATTAIILDRTFIIQNEGTNEECWSLNAELSICGKKAAFGPGWVDPVKKVIARTLGADMTRLMGHRDEKQSTADISVKLSLTKPSKEGRDLVSDIGEYIGSRVFSSYEPEATKHLKYGLTFIAEKLIYERDSIFVMDDLEIEELGPNLSVDLDKVRTSARYSVYWSNALQT